MPIAEVFSPVPHPSCQCHTVAEIPKAGRKAVAPVRKPLAAQMPKLPRGRPASPPAKPKARGTNKLQKKLTDLFDHRSLFVPPSLSPTDRGRRWRA